MSINRINRGCDILKIQILFFYNPVLILISIKNEFNEAYVYAYYKHVQ